MADRINWKCPKCGESNDIIIGNAPAVVTVYGILEEDHEFESWIENEINKPCDIAQQDDAVWACPNCGAEFPELHSDQDIGKFIKDNRTQLKMEE